MIAFPTSDGERFDPLAEKRLVATEREHCAHCQEMIEPGQDCWRVDVTAEVREHLHAECYPHRDFGSEEAHAHIRGSRSKINPAMSKAA